MKFILLVVVTMGKQITTIVKGDETMSLSELLAEIERRRYRWDIDNFDDMGNGKYCIDLFDWGTREYTGYSFYGKTPEEAAIKAITWIKKE